MGTVAQPDGRSLPSGEQLLVLEARVRRQGSGLKAGDLSGIWRLRRVWPRAGRHPAAATGFVLQMLQAQLTLAAAAEELRVGNSIRLGSLELCFEGAGRLQGRRPLLKFWFERLELKLGGRVLMQRTLARPPEQRLPFFALIHRDPAGWLAARGRGGGLAAWEQLTPADAN